MLLALENMSIFALLITNEIQNILHNLMPSVLLQHVT